MLLRVELQVSYLDGLKIMDLENKSRFSIEPIIYASCNICIARNCSIR